MVGGEHVCLSTDGMVFESIRNNTSSSSSVVHRLSRDPRGKSEGGLPPFVKCC